MSDMDRHVQQTNDRLMCIKQHLLTPQGFQNAARELLEWCSDTRAFQRPFEQSLITCLTVVSRVSAQPGYDLDLGYRLLAVCAAHRDKFTSKSAAMLSLWCEDLGRLLLLRHQKTRAADPPSGAASSPASSTIISNGTKANCANSMQLNPQLQKSLTPGPQGDPSMAWSQQGPHGPQQAQQLSVVTTVWGVTASSQNTPYNVYDTGAGFTNTTMSNSYPGPGPHYPGAQMASKANYGSPGPQGMNYGPQNNASAYSRGGYPPTPITPGGANMGPNAMQGPGGHPDFQPPPGALSAAAMVAAAATATATATATASMVALQQEQHHAGQMVMPMGMNNGHGQYPSPPSHMHNQHLGASQQGGMRSGGPTMGMGPSPGPMSGGPMTGGPMKHGAVPPGMYGAPPGRARPSPYPTNPQQYLMNKRQQYSNGPQMRSDYPVNQYGHAAQFGARPGTGYPAQQPLPSPTYPPQHPGVRPGYAVPNTGGPNPYMTQQYRGQAPPYTHPNFQNNMANMQPGPASTMNSMPYQHHSPIPGNPTPPMTPSNVLPPYLSPNQPADIKPNFQDIKPNMQPFKKEVDELRLTFPVRDGVVLPPFRLEHNLAVSNHVFHLRESVYQTLMWRSDLELQLKCFHHEDRQMSTNWPASVTVSVNATPLSIERGENKTSHKPLYLKEVCQPGRNTIQITVTACCCSHLFVLQLVHRPSVRSIMQGLLRKRLLPAEHCITKIKRNFTSVAANNNTTTNGASEDGVEQTAIKVSLKCPITFRRMTLPARGHDCKHIQCFNLESYLQLNCERGAWRCPVCNKPALLEGLEVDQYIWGILTNLMGTEFEEVTIDPTASWKPVQMKNAIKDEEPDGCAGRWMKAMSPSSTQLPTMNSWDFGPSSSPYPNIPPTSQGGRGTPSNPYGNGSSYPGSHPGNPGTPNGFPGNGFSSPPLSHITDSLSNDVMGVGDNFRVATPTTQSMFTSGPISNRSHGSNSQPNTPGTANPGTPNYSTNHHQPLSHVTNGTSLSNGLLDALSSADTPGTNHVTDPSNVLPFDPAAIIEGEGQGQEALDLLPENIGDPMELLSYLGPPDSSMNHGGNSCGSTSDDLLALFDT